MSGTKLNQFKSNLNQAAHSAELENYSFLKGRALPGISKAERAKLSSDFQTLSSSDQQAALDYLQERFPQFRVTYGLLAGSMPVTSPHRFKADVEAAMHNPEGYDFLRGRAVTHVTTAELTRLKTDFLALSPSDRSAALTYLLNKGYVDVHAALSVPESLLRLR